MLVVGTLAPGLGPKDVEKTISLAPREVRERHARASITSRASRATTFSIVYVWLKWGTDLNAAQTLVQQQVAFAMAAVPKSLGVLPPFVLQYDPSNAPVVQVAVCGRGVHRTAALRLRASTTSSRCWRGSRAWPARRSNGGRHAADQRRRRSRQGAGARRHRRRRRRARSRSSNALLPVGRVHLAEVRRQRLHERDPRAGARRSATRR